MPVKDISACFFCTRKTRIVYPYVGIIQIRLWVKTHFVYSQPAKWQAPRYGFHYILVLQKMQV